MSVDHTTLPLQQWLAAAKRQMREDFTALSESLPAQQVDTIEGLLARYFLPTNDVEQRVHGQQVTQGLLFYKTPKVLPINDVYHSLKDTITSMAHHQDDQPLVHRMVACARDILHMHDASIPDKSLGYEDSIHYVTTHRERLQATYTPAPSTTIEKATQEPLVAPQQQMLGS